MKDKCHICPWQGGSLLATPLRKPIHNQQRILSPYISKAMTALDIGCGMGYFSIPMSKMVGSDGRVIAADLQPEMLGGLKRKAAKKNCGNIIFHQCRTNSLCLEEWQDKIDFALIFWMLHEVPDSRRLINEIFAAFKNGGKLLFVEPKGHVNAAAFKKSVDMMTAAGFKQIDSPKIAFSRAVFLEK
jgi:ubiquinone/menaquinone biosynthesis C-methylase UbiE